MKEELSDKDHNMILDSMTISEDKVMKCRTILQILPANANKEVKTKWASKYGITYDELRDFLNSLKMKTKNKPNANG